MFRFMFLSFHLPFCSYSCGLLLCLWSWTASSMDCCLTGSLHQFQSIYLQMQPAFANKLIDIDCVFSDNKLERPWAPDQPAHRSIPAPRSPAPHSAPLVFFRLPLTAPLCSPDFSASLRSVFRCASRSAHICFDQSLIISAGIRVLSGTTYRHLFWRRCGVPAALVITRRYAMQRMRLISWKCQ